MTVKKSRDEIGMTQAIAWRIGKGYLRTRVQRNTYAYELSDFYRVPYTTCLAKIVRMLGLAEAVYLERDTVLLD